MIIILFCVVAVLLIVQYFFSPIRWTVHCARVGENPFGFISQRRTEPTLFFDENKKFISERNKFFGLACGDSMRDFGIRHGDEFIGAYIPKGASPKEIQDLAPKDSLVVVEGEPGPKSKIKYRMRQIEKYTQDGKVHFYPDIEGASHKARPISSIVALVEYAETH